ncbi:MAG: tRNA (N6-threonylcarbamoyladenosine(37)-N6)-methyltransferase TrmO [Methanoregula sp.]|nr:MAG: tRNA (N6-threonylcarbamoyladenosine(37)-N6)-methyltransferase TrmO [Methanoregula sp.]
MQMDLRPIGVVRSPYKTMSDAPHQGRLSSTVSEILIDEAFAPGLKDIGHHPNLIVLCWFDRADRTVLAATPPHLRTEHGVFATRSPNRPNPVGFCVVDLLERNGNVLKVRGLDAIDGTPVIDIKPYNRRTDCIPPPPAPSI